MVENFSTHSASFSEQINLKFWKKPHQKFREKLCKISQKIVRKFRLQTKFLGGIPDFGRDPDIPMMVSVCPCIFTLIHIRSWRPQRVIVQNLKKKRSKGSSVQHFSGKVTHVINRFLEKSLNFDFWWNFQIISFCATLYTGKNN